MKVAERLLALIQEIEVRPGRTAPRLAQKFDSSARTIERDIHEKLDARLTVTDPHAFLRWFSSLDHVQVVAPPAYRAWFVERLQKSPTFTDFLRQLLSYPHLNLAARHVRSQF